MIHRSKTGVLLACLALVFVLGGCNQQKGPDTSGLAAPERAVEIEEEPAMIQGEYKGMMPVAGEEDVMVDIRLVLYPDGTFNEYMDYTNRTGEIIYREGHYTHTDDKIILEPADGKKQYYKVLAGALRNLNEFGNPNQDSTQEYLLFRQEID